MTEGSVSRVEQLNMRNRHEKYAARADRVLRAEKGYWSMIDVNGCLSLLALNQYQEIQN